MAMKKLILSAAVAAACRPRRWPIPGMMPTASLLNGLAHPLIGGSPLAMVTVGLWSGFVLPRKVWAGAAAFMGAMLLGAGDVFAGIGFPMVEGAITRLGRGLRPADA
jgi:urease accessory protein